MAIAGRTCSECGASLSGKSPSAKTCGEKCRQVRSRRIKRANRQVQEIQDQQGAGAAEIAAIVRGEAPDVARKVIAEQMAPVVREALTEDVLRAVQQMLGLTPRAVQLLEQDLESEDSTIRQRAYTLVAKYTIGHPALLKADDADGSKQMVVNFNLPRPDVAENPEISQDAEIVEYRNCDICNTEKPLSEFVAGSQRCQACFEEWQAKIREQFA